MVREKKNYSGSQNSKSNRLDWILRKFFAELKTEKGQVLIPSVLTGIRAAIHRHLTCAPLGQNKHFARQRIRVFQQNVWSEGQAIYETMRNQNTNYLFSQEICRNWIDTSWKGGTRTAFGKMRRSGLSLFGFRCVFILLVVAERDDGSLQNNHLKQKLMTLELVTYVCTIWPWILIIMIIKWLLSVYLCPS